MHAAEQPLQAADLRGTLLLRDCLGAEGTFLLVHLVKAALGSGQPFPSPAAAPPAAASRVVLLAAAQAASHYAAVLRKAGLHCPTLLEAGRLAVVEALPVQAGLPSLRSLHLRVAAAACGDGGTSSSVGSRSSTCSSDCVLLLIDDLTALRCLADSEAEWAAFLQACTALGQLPGCCFVGLAHGDVPDDEGWLARLEHVASLVVDVEPLESGRSADTTGRLLVTRRAAAAAGSGTGAQVAAAAAASDSRWGVPGSRRFVYKLQETGASYVAV